MHVTSASLRAALPSLRSPSFSARLQESLPRGAAPSSVPDKLPALLSLPRLQPWKKKIIQNRNLSLNGAGPSAIGREGVAGTEAEAEPHTAGMEAGSGVAFGEVAQPPSPHPWPSPCREWEGPGRLAAVLGRDAGPAPALQQCLGEALASVGSVGCRPHPSSSGASRPPQTKLETNEPSGQWNWLRKKKNYSDFRTIPVSVKCPSSGAAFLGWAVSPREAGGWQLSPCRCPLRK